MFRIRLISLLYDLQDLYVMLLKLENCPYEVSSLVLDVIKKVQYILDN